MLPLNFHQTFIPERRLIGALLEYAALGKQGSYSEIAEETGIPMGMVNGKVPAIMSYAKGMGLINIDISASTKGYIPKLTSFGKVVYLEDKYMGEQIVQVIAHMNLCRSDIGAKVWRTLFAEGVSLGDIFTKAELEEYLTVRFGAGNKRGRIGPLVSTYTDDAALARTALLRVDGNKTKENVVITLNKAPVFDAFTRIYAAYITELLELFFPMQTQVTLTDFIESTKWFNICRWANKDIGLFFEQLERKGLISVDRQRQPWIIEKKYTAEKLWPDIFIDLA
jgi:hypothetical protein